MGDAGTGDGLTTRRIGYAAVDDDTLDIIAEEVVILLRHGEVRNPRC